MEFEDMLPVVEAVLFAGGEPVEASRLCEITGLVKQELEQVICALEDRYKDPGSGIELLRLNDSYQLATKQEFAAYIKSALEIKKNSQLSPAALETLTIIAYNQPVTKGFVENVRGVDSSGVVNSLVEKDLLAEAGRLDLPGRPIAYKTTDNFLRAFKLSSLKDLPPLPEPSEQVTIDEILENSRSEQDGEQ
ncbi:SMC-Scp complex subunit ScpB [Ruminococcus sp. FC2018]|uniref:SMC-Scp complex subunit ScpB n=1 Tax=Ruminococcus sp. FC2018 TaxID=1410617 RepID=UPI00048F88B1|nr:SMC-Scp complex subunit ScpB [Ruminococcus sp. FC2018]